MKKVISTFAPFIGFGIFLILWFILCSLEIFSPYVLPSPEKVFDSFLKMLETGEIFEDVLISFSRVFKGFFIAFFLAFALGKVFGSLLYYLVDGSYIL